jgi:hypothetical protein
VTRPDLTPGPEDLDPVETASIDELRSLQTERLRWSVRHAYDNVPHYRASFDSADTTTPIRTPSRSGSDPDPRNDSPDKWRSPGGSSHPRRDDFQDDRAEDIHSPVPELRQLDMANWTGQPSVRGSTEAIRMVLLSFCSIGIT